MHGCNAVKAKHHLLEWVALSRWYCPPSAIEGIISTMACVHPWLLPSQLKVEQFKSGNNHPPNHKFKCAFTYTPRSVPENCYTSPSVPIRPHLHGAYQCIPSARAMFTYIGMHRFSMHPMQAVLFIGRQWLQTQLLFPI